MVRLVCYIIFGQRNVHTAMYGKACLLVSSVTRARQIVQIKKMRIVYTHVYKYVFVLIIRYTCT